MTERVVSSPASSPGARPTPPPDQQATRNSKGGTELAPEAMREAMEERLGDLNEMMEYINTRLSFRLHEGTQRLMAQIIDIRTQEVVKEMPPEEMLNLIERIQEMVGLLIDERA